MVFEPHGGKCAVAVCCVYVCACDWRCGGGRRHTAHASLSQSVGRYERGHVDIAQCYRASLRTKITGSSSSGHRRTPHAKRPLKKEHVSSQSDSLASRGNTSAGADQRTCRHFCQLYTNSHVGSTIVGENFSICCPRLCKRGRRTAVRRSNGTNLSRH